MHERAVEPHPVRPDRATCSWPPSRHARPVFSLVIAIEVANDRKAQRHIKHSCDQPPARSLQPSEMKNLAGTRTSIASRRVPMNSRYFIHHLFAAYQGTKAAPDSTRAPPSLRQRPETQGNSLRPSQGCHGCVYFGVWAVRAGSPAQRSAAGSCSNSYAHSPHIPSSSFPVPGCSSHG